MVWWCLGKLVHWGSCIHRHCQLCYSEPVSNFSHYQLSQLCRQPRLIFEYQHQKSPIRQQIVYLKKLDPNYITLRLTDDSMQSVYKNGDYVGGSGIFGVDIQKLSGSVCILELIDGEKSLRELYYNAHKNIYEAKSLNEQAYPSITIPFNKLLIAAKVVWHMHLG